VALSVAGLLMLSGAPGGSVAGNALVLGNAVAQSLQIVSMERFAPRYDARALTFIQMGVSCVAFAAIALSRGELSLPREGDVWYALVVTGVFAGALGYLVATWVQSRATAARAAIVFTLEAPFAALFGVLLLSERLGAIGWAGCGVMLAGILCAEPAAATALRRLTGRPAPV
jgi:drug/metabolite transporter (DMT)-like permease